MQEVRRKEEAAARGNLNFIYICVGIMVEEQLLLLEKSTGVPLHVALQVVQTPAFLFGQKYLWLFCFYSSSV